MLSKNIIFKNFYLKKSSVRKKKKIFEIFKNFLKEKNPLLGSLNKNYKDQYSKKLLSKLKKSDQFTLIGMGGSILGAQAIYSFLTCKLKKFIFIDNFLDFFFKQKNTKKNTNIIISKSGNTLETISNVNILIKKNQKNIFITENKESYLMSLAKKLKSEVIHHNKDLFTIFL